MNKTAENISHLYAISHGDVACVVGLKLVEEVLDLDNFSSQDNLHLTRQSDLNSVLSRSVVRSIMSREFVRKALVALNPDVKVLIRFPDDIKKSEEKLLPYKKVEQLTEERPDLQISWWPVNFQTHDEAKQFALTYYNELLKKSEGSGK